jgi:hypothetical protein
MLTALLGKKDINSITAREIYTVRLRTALSDTLSECLICLTATPAVSVDACHACLPIRTCSFTHTYCHTRIHTLQGRGGGRVTLGLLLRYKRQPLDKPLGHKPLEKPLEKPLQKTLDKFERHVYTGFELCVLPSLSVAASVLPSYSAVGEYVLSLEITNYRTGTTAVNSTAAAAATARDDSVLFTDARDLLVRSVCGISRYWCMAPLTSSDTTTAATATATATATAGVVVDDSSVDEAMCHWQERLTLHYRLYPAPQTQQPLVITPDTSTSTTAATSTDTATSEHTALLPVVHSTCPLLQVQSAATCSSTSSTSYSSSKGDTPSLSLLCLEAAASALAVAEQRYQQRAAAEEAAGNSGSGGPTTIQVYYYFCSVYVFISLYIYIYIYIYTYSTKECERIASCTVYCDSMRCSVH